jgi:PKD repeat protein
MGENVTFNASSSYDPDWGSITAYIWNFDGEPKEVSDPNTTYPFPRYGEVRVFLVLRDTENLYSDPVWKDLTVYARPVADFSVSGEFYVGYALTFNASRPWSYDPDGSIINYTWNFGDGTGTSVSDSSITHTYLKNDTYTVELTVTDNETTPLSTSKTRIIPIGSGEPYADFMITSPGPYYVDEPLTFDASISDPVGGNITNYLWDFNDTTADEGRVINHTFTEPKTYNVTLTAIDEKGLNDSITKQVNVILRVYIKVEPETTATNPGEILTVNITVANVEDLKSFNFKLNWPPDWLPPYHYLLEYDTATEGEFLGPRTYPNGTIRWTGSAKNDTGFLLANYTFKPWVPKTERRGSGTLVTIRFRVLSSGNATLDLKETRLNDSLGNPIEHTAKDGYFYTTKPVANFTYSPIPAIANISVTFNASSSYDPNNGTIVDYFWDFDDGNNGTGQIVSHNYTDVGTFNVTLTVTDDGLPAPEKWSIVIPVKVISCRDVAVISVNPCANRTGWKLNITVAVRNEGEALETFNVTLYYCNITGSYAIETKTIMNLPPDSETTLDFTWIVQTDDFCVAKGNYNITAVADTVPYEEDIADNNRTNGLVAVIWLGDVTSEEHSGVPDDKVDEDDLWYFCSAFINYYELDEKDIFCDFDFNCKIDEDDLWKFSEGFIKYQKSD